LIIGLINIWKFSEKGVIKINIEKINLGVIASIYFVEVTIKINRI